MPRTAAKKSTTTKTRKATATKDLQVSLNKAGSVKAGMVKTGKGPAGTIWWNPIPIQPLEGKTKRSASRVGAHRKG